MPSCFMHLSNILCCCWSTISYNDLATCTISLASYRTTQAIHCYIEVMLSHVSCHWVYCWCISDWGLQLRHAEQEDTADVLPRLKSCVLEFHYRAQRAQKLSTYVPLITRDKWLDFSIWWLIQAYTYRLSLHPPIRRTMEPSINAKKYGQFLFLH